MGRCVRLPRHVHTRKRRRPCANGGVLRGTRQRDQEDQEESHLGKRYGAQIEQLAGAHRNERMRIVELVRLFHSLEIRAGGFEGESGGAEFARGGSEHDAHKPSK